MSKRISLACMRNDSVWSSFNEGEYDNLSQAIEAAEFHVKHNSHLESLETTHIAVIVFPISWENGGKYRIVAKFPIEENIRRQKQIALDNAGTQLICHALAFINRHDRFEELNNASESMYERLKKAAQDYNDYYNDRFA